MANAGARVAEGQARYFDALLAEMDRGLRPELTSGPAIFMYQSIRRIFARQAVQAAMLRGPGEIGTAAGPGGANWGLAGLGGAARREAEQMDAIEAEVDARLARIDAPATEDGAISQALVQSYLSSIGEDCATVRSLQTLAGGRSKQTVLLDVAGLRSLPGELVIRRDLHAGATGTTVADEFRLLQALANRGAPVPRPYRLETGVLSSAFMLMQRVPGKLRGDIMAPPPSGAAVLDSARALGRLHALNAAELAPALADHVRAKSAVPLMQEIAGLRATWDAQARDTSATVALAFEWLGSHGGAISPVETLVHGDYSFHNLLYDGDRLSAVLDWELAHIGHPAEDLGYIQTVASTVVPWDQYMAAYEAAGGTACDAVTVLFHAMLGTLRLMVLIQRARFMLECGLTDDLQLAEVAIYHLPKLVHKLSTELRRALGIAA